MNYLIRKNLKNLRSWNTVNKFYHTRLMECLKPFNELKESYQLESSGKFSEALLPIERIKSVVDSYMIGFSSVASIR